MREFCALYEAARAAAPHHPPVERQAYFAQWSSGRALASACSRKATQAPCSPEGACGKSPGPSGSARMLFTTARRQWRHAEPSPLLAAHCAPEASGFDGPAAAVMDAAAIAALRFTPGLAGSATWAGPAGQSFLFNPSAHRWPAGWCVHRTVTRGPGAAGGPRRGKIAQRLTGVRLEPTPDASARSPREEAGRCRRPALSSSGQAPHPVPSEGWEIASHWRRGGSGTGIRGHFTSGRRQLLGAARTGGHGYFPSW